MGTDVRIASLPVLPAVSVESGAILESARLQEVFIAGAPFPDGTDHHPVIGQRLETNRMRTGDARRELRLGHGLFPVHPLDGAGKAERRPAHGSDAIEVSAGQAELGILREFARIVQKSVRIGHFGSDDREF